jgi:hypothetical protein
MRHQNLVRKRQFGPNRKMVFELGDLRLWLNTEGVRPVKGAVLELMQRRLGAPSKWDLYWSGVVRIDDGSATVQTKKVVVMGSVDGLAADGLAHVHANPTRSSRSTPCPGRVENRRGVCRDGE